MPVLRSPGGRDFERSSSLPLLRSHPPLSAQPLARWTLTLSPASRRSLPLQVLLLPLLRLREVGRRWWRCSRSSSLLSDECGILNVSSSATMERRVKPTVNNQRAERTATHQTSPACAACSGTMVSPRVEETGCLDRSGEESSSHFCHLRSRLRPTPPASTRELPPAAVYERTRSHPRAQQPGRRLRRSTHRPAIRRSV